MRVIVLIFKGNIRYTQSGFMNHIDRCFFIYCIIMETFVRGECEDE